MPAAQHHTMPLSSDLAPILISMRHHHHHHDVAQGIKKTAPPPKGCMTIRVGGEGEPPQRFVVPVEYVNHPLFAGLLKEAEEEYGFEHDGAITIPCHVDDFCHVRRLIDREAAAGSHHHLHLAGCFKA